MLAPSVLVRLTPSLRSSLMVKYSFLVSLPTNEKLLEGEPSADCLYCLWIFPDLLRSVLGSDDKDLMSEWDCTAFSLADTFVSICPSLKVAT